MDVSSWFKGFEKGLEKLSGEERERLFFECGKNCVKNGVLFMKDFTRRLGVIWMFSF